MNQESLDKAMKNRNERKEKLRQYNKINHALSTVSDHDIIQLCRPCHSDALVEPTVDEYRKFLRTIRDRLDVEISDLDKEFEEL